MTSLLIDEPPLQVLPSLAMAIGLNEAIVVQQMHYWAKKSKVEKNGHRWVYNTTKQWAEQFPFWSEKTLKRTILALRESGLLIAEKLSDSAMDHTLFYRVNYDKLGAAIGSICPNRMGQSDPMHGVNLTQTLIDTETTTEKKKAETSPKPPKGASSRESSSIALSTWLDAIRAKGERPVPADDPIFAYAESAGIPDEFLMLAWAEFKRRFGSDASKRQKDWRRTFRNYVQGNYLKLWWHDGQGYRLTTAGAQAQNLQRKAA